MAFLWVGLKPRNTVLVCIVLDKVLYERMYRWLILSLTAYLIAHWTYLGIQFPSPPDWGQAAQTALESIFPQIVVSLLLLEIERLLPLTRSFGFDIHLSRCKM
ncbi:MAG: hypothetical protein KME57_16045 [Scytonema hyalinum WJT4-NPBG1]|jgi:hypothetical protein|nr:hypothetical protein [Scytonema hyalinum WJT4-NPBG1]